MTWSEFFGANRATAAAAREIGELLEGVLEDEDASPFDPDDEATIEGMVVLLLWQRLKAGTSRNAQAADAERRWKKVCVGMSQGELVRTFMSSDGTIEKLPETFFTAFTEDKPLDVTFRCKNADPPRVEVLRGDQVDFELPNSLVQHLIELRDRKSGAPGESHVPSH
jgi:hypothetical protein